MKEGVGRGRLGGHPIKDIIEKEYLGKKVENGENYLIWSKKD